MEVAKSHQWTYNYMCVSFSVLLCGVANEFLSYQVDVVGAQLLQTGVYGESHALCVVSHKVGLDLGFVVGSVARGILGREDDLVPNTALFHPLAQPGLRVFILVIVCTDGVSRWFPVVRKLEVLRVNEIAAILVESIQYLEGGFFVAFTQSLLPGRGSVSFM